MSLDVGKHPDRAVLLSSQVTKLSWRESHQGEVTHLCHTYEGSSSPWTMGCEDQKAPGEKERFSITLW